MCVKDSPAEYQCKREHQLPDIRRRLRTLHGGDAHVRERGREQHERENQQEEQTAALMHRIRGLRVPVQAHGVVKANEDDDSHERVPRDLHEDVGRHEDLPGECLGGALADLEEGALCDEVGEDLLDQVAEEEEDHEDGEHLVLQRLAAGSRVVEGEADEEALGWG